MNERSSPGPWRVGVVVPARNEEDTIAACIGSIHSALQLDSVGQSWIVVVADGCTDRTVERATQALAGHGEVVVTAVSSPGTARRLGVEALLRYLGSNELARLWIANTDADTYVPADWLKQHLRIADTGAMAVAGIVAVDSFENHGPDAAALFARDYTLSPDGSHPHVHGANIGIRADAYLDVGGWRDLSVSEDHCLWQRVRDKGLPVCSSAASVVTTSGRMQGRAHGGFADTLLRRFNLQTVTVESTSVSVCGAA